MAESNMFTMEVNQGVDQKTRCEKNPQADSAYGASLTSAEVKKGSAGSTRGQSQASTSYAGDQLHTNQLAALATPYNEQEKEKDFVQVFVDVVPDGAPVAAAGILRAADSRPTTSTSSVSAAYEGKLCESHASSNDEKLVSGLLGASFEEPVREDKALETVDLESEVDLYIQILILVNLSCMLERSSPTFSAVSLANCGFVMYRKSTSVSCPNCSQLTGNIPDVCNLLAYQYGRQADASDLLSQTDSLNEFEGLGINVNLSKHPEMAVMSRRLATFLTYPYKSAKHPEQLVEGGYFYSGISSVSSLKCVLWSLERDGESVTCYSCGIVSTDWTSRCDVFIRHARSSPTCAHVISTRGQQFVDDVLAEFGSYHSRPAEDKITTVTNRMLRPRMDSIPVQKTLDMGISSQAVRTVVAKRIKKGAPDFKYISEIVQEVKELNVPEGQLREAKDTSVVLPKVLNLPESESDKEEKVMSSADVQMDESAEQSSHVEDRTALSIETDKMEGIHVV
ncbi:BIRC7 [Bugula neritina]|uniref:BIRC7 n=1 Tax=Bugula neritina TaxID=10212 RepID=A0A7J7JKK3_BUGNE|nr:BIRC7 [Bugula neritina]